MSATNDELRRALEQLAGLLNCFPREAHKAGHEDALITYRDLHLGDEQPYVWVSDLHNALKEARAALDSSLGPTRWHEGMREWQEQVLFPAKFGSVTYCEPLCWAYVSDTEVCIQGQGHNNDIHEPLQLVAAAVKLVEWL